MNAAKLGLKEITVHFGAFDYDLICVVGPHKHVSKYVAGKNEQADFSFDPTQYRGALFHRAGYVPIIWLPRKPRTAVEHGALAHEVLHAVRIMLVDWAGMTLNEATDEAFCHALGTGVREILRALK